MADENESDISNTTLAILLILTILVTMVGTWLILDALHAPGTAPADKLQDQATVSLTVIKPPVSADTATVGLTILERPEKR